MVVGPFPGVVLLNVLLRGFGPDLHCRGRDCWGAGACAWTSAAPPLVVPVGGGPTRSRRPAVGVCRGLGCLVVGCRPSAQVQRGRPQSCRVLHLCPCLLPRWQPTLASGMMVIMRSVDVFGDVADGFGPVAEAFEGNFSDPGEDAAAVAVFSDGVKVVDLWAGSDIVYKRPMPCPHRRLGRFCVWRTSIGWAHSSRLRCCWVSGAVRRWDSLGLTLILIAACCGYVRRCSGPGECCGLGR